MAVNCLMKMDEARKPEATAKRIASSSARKVRQKQPSVTPPINICRASKGKIAARP